VTYYLAWPRHTTLHDTLSFVDFSIKAWEVRSGYNYLIFSKDDHPRLLGGTGVMRAGRDDDGDSESVFNGGYVLAKDVWGQGYGTEVWSALLDVVRDLGGRRVEILIHKDNHASQRLAEKCGMTRYHHQQQPPDSASSTSITINPHAPAPPPPRDEFTNHTPGVLQECWLYIIDLSPPHPSS